MPFLIPLMPHLLRISTYALLAFLFYHFSSLMPFLKTPGAQAPRWLLGVGLLFAAIYNFQSSRHCTQCPKSHATHPQNVNTERSPISGSHAQSAAPHASNSHTWIRWFWGLLPCPLVIAMLIASRGTDSAMHAATFMFCFGLGTLPALIGFTWTTQRTFSTLGKSSRHWFTRYWFKSTFWVNKHQVLTALLFIGGLWTIGSEWLMPHHHHHHVATQNTQDTSPHSIRQLTRHTSTTPQPARTHTHE